MFKIYTKLEGKLAQWSFDSHDYLQGINAVRREVGRKHTGAILALIEAPKQIELDFEK